LSIPYNKSGRCVATNDINNVTPHNKTLEILLFLNAYMPKAMMGIAKILRVDRSKPPIIAEVIEDFIENELKFIRYRYHKIKIRVL